jgi:hypothetical protein
MEELGKVGLFFGIITFLFGLFLLFESAIVGLIVMTIGIGIIYGSSRGGGGIGSGGGSRSDDISRYGALNSSNPNSPNYYKKW